MLVFEPQDFKHYVHAVPAKTRREHQILELELRSLGAAMPVLGMDPESTGNAANDLNH